MKSGIDFLTACLDPQGKDRPHGSKTAEYVLFKRVAPVMGQRVQHRVKHQNHHPGTFADLYNFRQELPAHIKEVVIHSGIGHDHEDGARWVCYTNSQHWLLNNDGERIRVVGPTGTVLASWDVPAHTCQPLSAAPKAVLVGGGAATAAFGEVS